MNQTLFDLVTMCDVTDIIASMDMHHLFCVFLCFLTVGYHYIHNARFGKVDDDIIRLQQQLKELKEFSHQTLDRKSVV